MTSKQCPSNSLFPILTFFLLSFFVFSTKGQAQHIGIYESNPTSTLHVRGERVDSQTYSFSVQDSSGKYLLRIRDDGRLAVLQNGPDGSSVFDIGSHEWGVLLPRLTTAQRDQIVSPAAGLVIFNVSDSCLHFFNQAAWLPVCGQ